MLTDTQVAADWENRCFAEMTYLQRNIGELNQIREGFSGDWEIEELTRAIIHEEAQLIEMLKGEIEDGREAARKSA